MKDLGILVDCQLNFSRHVTDICKRANSRMYLLRKCFSCTDSAFLVSMYKAYIRPLIEYATCVWSPHFLKDAEAVEGVQRRFVRWLFPNIHPYEARLAAAGFNKLSVRRDFNDLCMVFKFLHSDLLNSVFTVDNSSVTRGHDFKLHKFHSRLEIRRHFFSFRTVNHWNKLPRNIVNAPSLKVFKSTLCNMSTTSDV